ncbi:MAG: hypothetical protein H6672_19700 [Anaerolineaceae bacterium]|nr:hypothetical protein [Anaerolineaceae bacterium]
MTDIIQQLAVQQFQQQSPAARIIILHPNYEGQHALLPSVFAVFSSVIYVRLTGMALEEDDLRAQVEAAAKSQGGLAATSCIVLDEGDRANDEALQKYLEAVLEQANQTKIVLLGRRMPLATIASFKLKNMCCVLPTALEIGLPDYCHPASKDLLEVQALGAGRVVLNGRQIDNWDGTLPRALFFYLIDRGMVTRSEIFQTFWPSLTIKEATNVFHVTKRKINEVLGIELTEYKAGFYHITAKIDLVYDISLFSDLVQQSYIAAHDQAKHLLEKAITLYKGAFLSQMSGEWVTYRRQQMIQDYGDAMLSLAKLNEQDGQMDAALGLYLRALETNRRREDVVRSIMELYQQREMVADALAVYNRLSLELDKTLGVSPAPVLQRLKSAIEAGVKQEEPVK